MQVPIILIALVLGFGAERSLAPGPISGTPDAQDTANQRTGSWVRHDDGALRTYIAAEPRVSKRLSHSKIHPLRSKRTAS